MILIPLQWDDRITTLPGLYLITVGIIKPFSYWIGKDLCDLSHTAHFRATNIVLSLCNFFLYIWITRKTNRNEKVS